MDWAQCSISSKKSNKWDDDMKHNIPDKRKMNTIAFGIILGVAIGIIIDNIAIGIAIGVAIGAGSTISKGKDDSNNK